MQNLFSLPESWLFSFGILSAALSLFAFLPYIRDVLSGITQPQRASWLIWTVLSSIAFCAQVHEGASTSLWFAGAQVAGTVTIFLLAVTRGRGAFLTRPDERVLWLAAIGLVVWYFTETAVYALALTITVSLLGGSLTIAKAFQRPGSETLATWALSLVASCFGFLSVGTGGWALMAYPVYLIALNTAIVAAIVAGRAVGARQAVMGLPRF